ncbi:hypothetical protein C8J57DRAFT_1492374 [Mycena rebaudengoi]|nr:hypothetical protein C8J57DRAFT_1492374 [Mycena rebaudengoi]
MDHTGPAQWIGHDFDDAWRFGAALQWLREHNPLYGSEDTAEHVVSWNIECTPGVRRLRTIDSAAASQTQRDFVVALLYPVCGPDIATMHIPFDVGSVEQRSVRDLDINYALGMFHGRSPVVDISQFVTFIQRDGLNTFAVLHPPYCSMEPENLTVRLRMDRRLRDVAIVVALDENGHVRDIVDRDHKQADEAVAQRQGGGSSTVLRYKSKELLLDVAPYVFELCDLITLCHFAEVYVDIQTFFEAWVGRWDSPTNMNIAVPAGTFGQWEVFLVASGASAGVTLPIIGRYHDVVARFVRFRLTMGGRTVRITVSESKTTSVLAVALASYHTSQMTLTTSTHSICCYPQYTTNLTSFIGLTNYAKNATDEYRYKGFHVLTSLSSQRLRCGASCGYIWWRSFGMEGVAVVRIANGGREAIAAMKREDLKWRLDRECINVFCPNFRYSVRL